MPVIDLTRYIVASAGTWTNPSQDQNLFGFTIADTMSPERLMLRWAGDFVALTGPLAVRVTVQAENLTLPLALVGNLIPAPAPTFTTAGGAAAGTATIAASTSLSEASLGRFAAAPGLSLQASTIYDYTLNIAAGQAWPFNLSEQLDALRARNPYASRFEQLGNNLGYRVIIEPAFTAARLTPVSYGTDLPCDFAVADHPNTASFFPVACEPCEGSVIGLPPSGSVTLVTPPADGGCVRTRFFNGMFITREDLETEQRYHRNKDRLHNRVMGAGVGWGLPVGKQGSAVCVGPGYAVDCCGNDLALTTAYKVDVAALLADPAAASLVHQRGPQPMHLLLEYVECPSDPRPVHGDPCVPEASRCEMSRIRESVRLRLVPPRDYDAAKESAPIAQFLNEVRELQKRFPIGPGPTVVGADHAPFQLHLTLNGPNNTTNSITLRPSPDIKTIQGLPTLPVNSLTVDVQLDPQWTFVAGSLSGQVEPQSANVVQPPDPVDLSLATGFESATLRGALRITFDLSQAHARNLVFKIAGWQAQNLFAGEGDPAPSGDLTLTMQLNTDGAITQNTLDEKPIVTQPLDLAPAPCDGEPCAPRAQFNPGNIFQRAVDSVVGAFTDPTPVLPWLHPDPAKPSSAGDPKALVLAALGGWLAQMLVRERAGTANEVLSTRREIAQGIYRLAWVLLFGVSQKADAAALGVTLKRLLEAWCDGLLWRGPQCCGDPHGVVIGCATVAGGTIQGIDPFGGRRYVVHYPLLEHWGAQFGIAPLDVMASRFFSKLCCVSALPALGVASPNVPVAAVALGAGQFVVGDPKEIATLLERAKVTIVARRSVGLPEMIASALALSGTQPSPTQGEQRQYTALVLDDFVANQTVMLFLPA
jgi:hypothetical protein